jgi:hypothetical protein
MHAHDVDDEEGEGEDLSFSDEEGQEEEEEGEGFAICLITSEPISSITSSVSIRLRYGMRQVHCSEKVTLLRFSAFTPETRPSERLDFL